MITDPGLRAEEALQATVAGDGVSVSPPRYRCHHPVSSPVDEAPWHFPISPGAPGQSFRGATDSIPASREKKREIPGHFLGICGLKITVTEPCSTFKRAVFLRARERDAVRAVFAMCYCWGLRPFRMSWSGSDGPGWVSCPCGSLRNRFSSFGRSFSFRPFSTNALRSG
jgi:hypothetical protein